MKHGDSFPEFDLDPNILVYIYHHRNDPVEDIARIQGQHPALIEGKLYEFGFRKLEPDYLKQLGRKIRAVLNVGKDNGEEVDRGITAEVNGGEVHGTNSGNGEIHREKKEESISGNGHTTDTSNVKILDARGNVSYIPWLTRTYLPIHEEMAGCYLTGIQISTLFNTSSADIDRVIKEQSWKALQKDHESWYFMNNGRWRLVYNLLDKLTVRGQLTEEEFPDTGEIPASSLFKDHSSLARQDKHQRILEEILGHPQQPKRVYAPEFYLEKFVSLYRRTLGEERVEEEDVFFAAEDGKRVVVGFIPTAIYDEAVSKFLKGLGEVEAKGLGKIIFFKEGKDARITLVDQVIDKETPDKLHRRVRLDQVYLSSDLPRAITFQELCGAYVRIENHRL